MKQNLVTIFRKAQNLIWKKISYFVVKDFKKSYSLEINKTCLENMAIKSEAKLHLSHKHLPILIDKVLNDLLMDKCYVVTSTQFCFHGMDIYLHPYA